MNSQLVLLLGAVVAVVASASPQQCWAMEASPEPEKQTTFCEGDVVRIVGLVKGKKYNGSVGYVVKPNDGELTRWMIKLEFPPGPMRPEEQGKSTLLSAKPANLVFLFSPTRHQHVLMEYQVHIGSMVYEKTEQHTVDAADMSKGPKAYVRKEMHFLPHDQIPQVQHDLAKAAWASDIAAAKDALARGANPSYVQGGYSPGGYDGARSRTTPLFAAAQLRNFEMADLLLKAGAKPDLGSMSTTPPGTRVVACLHMDESTTQQYFKMHNMQEGCSPLLIAAEYDAPKVVSLLVKHGAEVDGRTESGMTALFAAATKGNINSFRTLTSLGADINAVIDKGQSIISIAAGTGRLDIVRSLCSLDTIDLEAGLQPPFCQAVTNLHWECAAEVARRGANVNRGDSSTTPLTFVANMLNGQERLAALEFLAKHSVDFSDSCAKSATTPGLTVLHALAVSPHTGEDLASHADYLKAFAFCVDKGADPGVKVLLQGQPAPMTALDFIKDRFSANVVAKVEDILEKRAPIEDILKDIYKKMRAA